MTRKNDVESSAKTIAQLRARIDELTSERAVLVERIDASAQRAHDNAVAAVRERSKTHRALSQQTGLASVTHEFAANVLDGVVRDLEALRTTGK